VYLHLRTLFGAGVCGGSILTKRHILTAGHCLHDGFGLPVIKIRAYYGNNDWRRGKIVNVTKSIRHPKYNKKTGHNDIAILEVAKPFQYGINVRPICIPAAPMNIFDTEAIIA
ncbi:hypothetical protein MTO96_045578, partial [Rhipicephalus appendiculatus]